MQSPAKGKGKGRARKRGRGGEQRAETAGEAAAQVLVKKRLSSKINYAALQNLFQEPAAPGSREDAGAVNRSRDANRHEQALLEERRSGPERTATGRLGSLTGRPGRASMRSSVLNRGAAQARRVRFTENPAPSGD
jgi:transcription factor IIIB subunit 2